MKRLITFGIPFLLILGLVLVSFSTLKEDSGLLNSSAKENYKQYCASCHGENLKSFVDRDWIYGNSWNEVFQAIKVGYPNDGMPAYDTTFTDKEIGALTDYILKGIENLTFENMEEEDNFNGVIKSEEQDFKVQTLADGMRIPWGMAFLPNGDMLITDREGPLYLKTKNSSRLKKIDGVPGVKSRGQGGLLDVVLHPDFEKNKWIYLSFSKPKAGNSSLATTAVVRAKLNGTKLSKVEEIFEAKPYLPTTHHYGSRLAFDKDGYLFLSVGDRGRRSQNPQSLDNHCGKIHRIKDDGSIPNDNPFAKQSNAMTSIWSYGHRNPQGLSIHPETGEIWEHEHGPRGGDEINLVQKSKNYGWPVISYGINYSGTKFTSETSKEGMLQPELYWVPSIGPSGMDFVEGDRYPAWKGDLLVGSLRFQYLNRCKMEDGKVIAQEKLLKNIGRVRDVRMGPDGYIYVAIEDPGRIVKIIPVQ